jgi:flagellar biosynthetic protein FlhB
MAVVAMAAPGIGVLQTGGLNFHVEAIGVKFDRVNPISNIKNLFSLRAAARLAKSLFPASLLAVFAVQRIARQLTIPPFSITRLETLGSDIYGLLLAAAWLLFGWSAIDYLVEWQSRESRLKMSKQDMRDENKETEGSPQIRGRIRNLQRQARRRRVKDDVSKAAVVLTNPTHYAVALGFDFATMEAPRVMAKGRNLLAEEIKAEARWAGVPIIENPPLARSLYRSVEVGPGTAPPRPPRPAPHRPQILTEAPDEHRSFGPGRSARAVHLASPAGVCIAAGRHQRDLCHAGAAAGLGP